MRELTYVTRNTVEWREAPEPELRSGEEAIVAPVAATSCDVDSSILAGHGFLDPPFALGHDSSPESSKPVTRSPPSPPATWSSSRGRSTAAPATSAGPG